MDDKDNSRRILDDIDVTILRTLQDEGRTSWARLAERIDLSAPSATERVKRLEESGHIQGFHATLDPKALDLGTLGFVAVSIENTAEHYTLLEQVKKLSEVQECHVVAGEHDYLLKIRARGPEALAKLLREEIRNLPGVSRTHTLLVLETVKETSALPVADAAEPDPKR